MKTVLNVEFLEKKTMLATLVDAKISNYVNSSYQDGYLSRQEIINVVKLVANNTANYNQIKDLQTLANSNTYKEDPYAKILLQETLNSPANKGHDLKVGTISTETFKLIDKWFYGKDHPTLPNYNIRYVQVNGNAVVNGTSSNDVQQGYLGDCWFLASLNAVADKTGVNNFVYNGDNTWTFWFYHFNNGQPIPEAVTVDRYLPIWNNSGTAVFASFGGTYNNPNNELWPALEEKAYAQYNQTGYNHRDSSANDYMGALNGGLGVMDQITGMAISQNWNVNSGEYLVQNALNNGNYVVIYRWMNSSHTSAHAYSVQSYSNGIYKLINPWGVQNLNLTWDQIKTQCFGFAIGKRAVSNTLPSVSVFSNVTIKKTHSSHL